DEPSIEDWKDPLFPRPQAHSRGFSGNQSDWERTPMTPFDPARDIRVLRDPTVYLVGRQVVDDAAIDRFLADHGVTWQTDTEVASEFLAEVAGRVCYMS